MWKILILYFVVTRAIIYILFNQGINNLRTIKLKLDKIYFDRSLLKLGNLRITNHRIYITLLSTLKYYHARQDGEHFLRIMIAATNYQQYTYIKTCPRIILKPND